MKLLAIGRLRQGADAREITRHAGEEMRVLWQLYRGGVVREMYSPGGPGAVLVLETAARKDAEATLAALPLAAGGVIVFELIELHPFSAFEVLFADQPAHMSLCALRRCLRRREDGGFPALDRHRDATVSRDLPMGEPRRIATLRIGHISPPAGRLWHGGHEDTVASRRAADPVRVVFPPQWHDQRLRPDVTGAKPLWPAAIPAACAARTRDLRLRSSWRN